MKTLTSKQIGRIQERDIIWHEGVDFEIAKKLLKSDVLMNPKNFAYWEEVNSYVIHKYGNVHYWVITKDYFDGLNLDLTR